MAKAISIIVATALLVVGFSVATGEAGKKRHSHKVAVQHRAKTFNVPSGDVNGELVFCPHGSRATGGGVVAEGGFPLVSDAGIVGRDSYRAIVVNDGVNSSSVQVQVACLKGKTKAARAREVPRAALRDALERRVDELRDERR